MNELKFKLSEDGCTVTGYEIQELEIPEGVTTIEKEVFSKVKTLKKVILPSTMTAINDYAFAGCEELEEINFPAALSYLGDAAFGFCKSLKRVNIDPGNNHFVIDKGILYTSDMSTIVRVLDSPESSHVILTEKQKSSHMAAFAMCPSITHFTFARPVNHIADIVFCECKNLKQVDLVDGICSIGDNCFYGTAIENIKLPNTVEEIGEGAFASCKSLKSIEIPDKTEVIHIHTFDRCENLKRVVVGDGLCFIEDDAFNGCPRDMEIIVPEGKTVASYDDDSEIDEFIENDLFYIGGEVLLVPWTLAGRIKGEVLDPEDTRDMLRELGFDDDDTADEGDANPSAPIPLPDLPDLSGFPDFSELGECPF